MKKKRIFVTSVGVVTAAAIATGSCIYYRQSSTIEEMSNGKKDIEMMAQMGGGDGPSQMMQMGEMENAISGSSSTYLRTTEQQFSLNKWGRNVVLVVEEVLKEAGDSVEAGEALYKLNTDNIDTILSYYASILETARNNLESIELSYETDIMEAEAEYEANQLKSTSAGIEYDEALEELQSELDDIQMEIEDVTEEIEEYQKKLEEDEYYTEYKLGDLNTSVIRLTDTYNEAVAAYEEKYETLGEEISSLGVYIEALNTSLEEKETAYNEAQEGYDYCESLYNDAVNVVLGASQVTAGMLAELSEAKSNFQTAKSTLESCLNEYDAAKTELSQAQISLTTMQSEYRELENNYNSSKTAKEQQEKLYQQALENYEKAVENANSKIEELNKKLETLNQEYETEYRNMQNETITLQKEYEQSLILYENATVVYETAVTELENRLESAKQAVTEAEEDYEYVKSVADNGGYILAEESGVIASMGYEAEDIVMNGGTVAQLYDMKTIYVSISVSQDDIAEIKIGQSATAVVSGSRYEGVVSEICMTPETGNSVSSVTYSVTTAFENTTGEIGSGSQATVLIMEEKVEENNEKED